MNRAILRRNVLRASGVCLSVPILDAMLPKSVAATEEKLPRRMVAINVGLGLHAPNIVPKDSGFDYTATPYLDVLQEFRSQFTFFSGTSHPGVGGGHQSGKSFLTAAKHPNSAGFRNSISIDQFAAEQLGTQTRFRSLSLSSSAPGLSWSRSGVEIPTITRPSRIYQQLFLTGKATDRQKQIERLKDGQSVLDAVLENASRMKRTLGNRDRQKLEQYFAAVREAEQRLVRAEAWASQPKPKVDVPEPRDETDRTRMIECQNLIYDMMHLAIQTDSTRFLTYYNTGMNAVPAIKGVDTDYHMLSHHARDEGKIAQLTIVETETMAAFGRFLKKLLDSQEGGETLLDRTMILFGSNLGNASSHDTKNMPVVLAGGGFRHGQHLAFDRDNNYELPKLYVSMLQRLGLEVEQFSDTVGTMAGLEMI